MENEYKEEALRLFEKFQQYDWDEVIGWTPNERKSKRMAEDAIDEIIRELDYVEAVYRIGHYEKVRKELRAL